MIECCLKGSYKADVKLLSGRAQMRMLGDGGDLRCACP